MPGAAGNSVLALTSHQAKVAQASPASQSRTTALMGFQLPLLTSPTYSSRIGCEIQLRPVQAGNSPLQQPEEMGYEM